MTNTEFTKMVRVENERTFETCERKLNKYKEKMNGNTFINDHNGKMESCDAIVMLVDGYVCPYFKNTTFSLNRLYIDRDENVHLSTSSVGGKIHGSADIYKSIMEYNASVHLPRYSIYGYIEV